MLLTFLYIRPEPPRVRDNLYDLLLLPRSQTPSRRENLPTNPPPPPLTAGPLRDPLMDDYEAFMGDDVDNYEDSRELTKKEEEDSWDAFLD
jgi:hypothetical protein